MKHIIIIFLVFGICGCSTLQVQDRCNTTIQCPGSVNPPIELEDNFLPDEDESLLIESLGKPGEGGLCQGKVYKTKENTHVNIYRAWNSTHPDSKMGKWWSFEIPTGLVAQYRIAYEICYGWSPLDKMTHCTLKPGAPVVIGTGQSAKCSEYLTYPASAMKQIYIKDAPEWVCDCVSYDGEFSWKVIE